MTEYVVKQGDCLSSIAHAFGFTWQKLWNDPANADLRSLRKDPNVLYPGDVVNIPDRTEPSFSLTPNKWNRFVVSRKMATLQVRVRINGTPISDRSYALMVDGASQVGATDGTGLVTAAVPPDAKEAVLSFKNGPTYRLHLGALDPVDTTTGVQARLAQLGFYAGAVDGLSGTYTEAALRFFQASVGLPTTGFLDDATREALREAHGC
jgi:N-acetylmuramoyl-L-alanine amidase